MTVEEIVKDTIERCQVWLDKAVKEHDRKDYDSPAYQELSKASWVVWALLGEQVPVGIWDYWTKRKIELTDKYNTDADRRGLERPQKGAR